MRYIGSLGSIRLRILTTQRASRDLCMSLRLDCSCMVVGCSLKQIDPQFIQKCLPCELNGRLFVKYKPLPTSTNFP